MPAITPEQVAELAETASALLGEAASLTSGDRGEYIRDGNPENVFDAIPLAMARQGCRRYADNPGNPTAARQARVERACRPYLDSLEYGLPPQLEQPFEGGQCEINYFVQYSYNTVNTDGSPGQTFTPEVGPIFGPIRGIERRGSPGNYIAVITSGDGVESVVNSSAAPQGGLENLKITQIFAQGGGSGPDCGNPPPDYRPPTPPPTPGPVKEPFTIAPNIDIEIGVEVNPDLTFDIDIGTGPITIDPFGDGGGDGGGGDGGDPGDPTDPGFEGFPEGTGFGGDAEGIAPPGTELVGLLVTVSQVMGDANRFANNSKQPFRGIGYVRMGYPGRLGLDISGGTVISPQFFHAQQRGLTAWAVAANIGFNLTVQPYFRDIES